MTDATPSSPISPTSPDSPSLLSLRRLIRDVPDFPKPGILFRDMTPLMADAPALRTCIDLLAAVVAAWKPELIIGIESRGFIFGVPVALALGIGFAPIRKPGKLPHQRVSRKYQLEYGHDVIEMHADAVRTGLRVAIVDDLLATGGTAGAAAEMVREQGANLVGLAFVVELAGLQGRARLGGAAASSLITY